MDTVFSPKLWQQQGYPGRSGERGSAWRPPHLGPSFLPSLECSCCHLCISLLLGAGGRESCWWGYPETSPGVSFVHGLFAGPHLSQGPQLSHCSVGQCSDGDGRVGGYSGCCPGYSMPWGKCLPEMPLVSLQKYSPSSSRPIGPFSVMVPPVGLRSECRQQSSPLHSSLEPDEEWR